MRIGITLLLGKTGGTRSYALNLIENLLKINNEHEYFVFSDKKTTLPSLESATWVYLPMISRYLRPVLWDNYLLSKSLKKYAVDLLHDTRNVLPLRPECRTIVTLHDMAPFILPETFSYLRRMDHLFNMRNAANIADHIIAPSESTKKDIINVLEISSENISIIPEAAPENFIPIQDESIIEEFKQRNVLPERFILTVGTTQGRKNIPLLIKAYLHAKELIKFPHHLVIAGHKKFSSASPYVHFIKDMPDWNMPLLYNSSEIFISTSSYEGFGLSIIEAMACGIPVVVGNNSAVSEVAGDAGLFINNLDIDNISKAIIEIVSSKEKRKTLGQKVKLRADTYSWRKTAEETLKVYFRVNKL